MGIALLAIPISYMISIPIIIALAIYLSGDKGKIRQYLGTYFALYLIARSSLAIMAYLNLEDKSSGHGIEAFGDILVIAIYLVPTIVYVSIVGIRYYRHLRHDLAFLILISSVTAFLALSYNQMLYLILLYVMIHSVMRKNLRLQAYLSAGAAVAYLIIGMAVPSTDLTKTVDQQRSEKSISDASEYVMYFKMLAYDEKDLRLQITSYKEGEKEYKFKISSRDYTTPEILAVEHREQSFYDDNNFAYRKTIETKDRKALQENLTDILERYVSIDLENQLKSTKYNEAIRHVSYTVNTDKVDMTPYSFPQPIIYIGLNKDMKVKEAEFMKMMSDLGMFKNFKDTYQVLAITDQGSEILEDYHLMLKRGIKPYLSQYQIQIKDGKLVEARRLENR